LRQLLLALLVLLAIYLTSLVLAPFIVAMLWAVILAILFHRTHATLTKRIGPSWSAAVTTCLVALLIAVPAIALASRAARDAPHIAAYFEGAVTNVSGRVAELWQFVRLRSPIELPPNPEEMLLEGVRRGATLVASRAGSVAADAIATFLNLLAMLVALFFMLRDGERMRAELRGWLPLPEESSDQLLSEIHDLVIGSVGAGLVVAVVQGAIGGLAFWMLKLGDPVFWGVAMAVCALLPVGAALVWLPAALWLLLSGEVGRGTILLLIGVGITTVGDILRPLLLRGRSSMSAFVVLFGILGGVAAFGFIGLVIGPIILSVTGNLFRILRQPDLAPTAPSRAKPTLDDGPILPSG
jgi:predicted PurR-regulated permease PerM